MKLLTITELAEELGLEPGAGKARIWRLVKSQQLRPTALTKRGRALFDADELDEISKQVFSTGERGNEDRA